MASKRSLECEEGGSDDLQPILAGELSGSLGGRGLYAGFESNSVEL